MKKKIIQITAIDASMNTMLNLLNERTKESGFEVHCICSPGEGTQKIIESGYIYHPVKIERKISPLSNLKAIYKIYKIIQNVQPDIVHVHTPIAAVVGRVAAKLAGVKNIIYTAHGFYFHDGMKRSNYNIFFNIEKYIGRYFTDWIFTQSEEDYQLAKKEKFLKNQNQYVHISNGIDVTERFNLKKHRTKNNNIRAQYGIHENDLLLVFVGRLVKEKGIIELIDAYQNLNHKTNIRLMIIGRIPETERDTSINQILFDQKNENIIWTGLVSNVEDYLYASDIFILPSYREGMPRSIIEAMAMGNAIIATNIRGSREEVDNNVNGLLVKVKNHKEISEAIFKLYKDKGKLKSMQEAAFEKATKLYDEEKVVLKQINIFNKITSKSSEV